MNDLDRGKIKIVLCPGSLFRGGAEHVTVRLAEYFAGCGFHTAILTGGEPGDNEYSVPDGVERISVGICSKNYISSIRAYRKALKKCRPTVLIIMGTPLCSFIVPAAIGLGIHVIASERNDPTHFAGRKITKCLMEFWMRYADGYVFQTKAARDYYEKRYKGKTRIKVKTKSAVIPNPLFADVIPEKKETNPDLIVGVGRLNPQKNWPMLIRAFSFLAVDYPDLILIIYGEGVLRQELEDLIRNMKMEGRIFLPGNVDDVMERESSARLFVMTSNFEGMPNALMEAMAIGLPCISTDCPCGGPRELIENGVNGLLVPVGDEVELAVAIRKLLDDDEMAKRFGNAAKRIKEKYSMTVIGSKWEKAIINDSTDI